MADVDDQIAAVTGAILGCAVGDALGLPYEGLSKRRGVRLLGEPTRYRLVFGHGMVSDDTEHTCMVAQALCAAPNDPERFARELSSHLRWWLLGVPAGIGLATLRSILKLWFGFHPSRSGVFSAGNGPAMRSPILGAAIDDLETLQRFVHASTTLTHTDPKAYHGAFATAFAAWCAKRGVGAAADFFEQYNRLAAGSTSEEFVSLMNRLETSLSVGETTETFAESIGCIRGVSGYVFRTVPVALHAWLSDPRDYARSVGTVIRCGGDTDTTAAIVGAIVGAGVGPAGIPQHWRDGLWEWPRSVNWMSKLADSTAQSTKTGMSVPGPQVIPGLGYVRNAIFLSIVLGHVARRMLPPY